MANVCCPQNAFQGYGHPGAMQNAPKMVQNAVLPQFCVQPMQQSNAFVPQTPSLLASQLAKEGWQQVLPANGYQHLCVPYNQEMQSLPQFVQYPQQNFPNPNPQQVPEQVQNVKLQNGLSKYIIAGKLQCDCICNRRNGLQDDCSNCRENPMVTPQKQPENFQMVLQNPQQMSGLQNPQQMSGLQNPQQQMPVLQNPQQQMPVLQSSQQQMPLLQNPQQQMSVLQTPQQQMPVMQSAPIQQMPMQQYIQQMQPQQEMSPHPNPVLVPCPYTMNVQTVPNM